MTIHRFSRPAILTASLLAIAMWHGGARFPAQTASKLAEPRQGLTKERKFPRQILLIRHGEKVGTTEDLHLSEAGKERAKRLPLLFEKSEDRPEPLAVPDFIFSARDTKSSHRPRETVTPLATQLKLPIDDAYRNMVSPDNPKAKGAADLRDELFKNPKYAGKTILISWHHGTMPELAQTLRATDAPRKWRDAVFDRVWKITYDESGKATFANLPQRLMPGDSPK